MRGSIKKRGNSYLLRIDIGKDINGKRKQHTESFKTKKEAEKRLGEILNQVNTGTYIKPEKMTFGELLDTFIQYRENNLKQKTIDGYLTIINNHLKPELGNIRISELRPLHIEQYLFKTEKEGRKDGKKDKLSKTTLLHHYRLIHTVLEYAVKRELLARNVAKNIQAPKADTKEKEILTIEQVNKLLSYLEQNRYSSYIPVLLAIHTGMRLSEIFGLTWDDVNMQEGTITVNQTLKRTKKGLLFEAPKTQKSKRKIYVADIVMETLKKHKAFQKELALKTGQGKRYNSYNLVCCTQKGLPWNTNNFSNKIKGIMKKLEIPGSFHSLRHTHASLLNDMGIDLKNISERLGHSNINTTANIYTHVFAERQKEIAQKFGEYMAR